MRLCLSERARAGGIAQTFSTNNFSFRYCTNFARIGACSQVRPPYFRGSQNEMPCLWIKEISEEDPIKTVFPVTSEDILSECESRANRAVAVESDRQKVARIRVIRHTVSNFWAISLIELEMYLHGQTGGTNYLALRNHGPWRLRPCRSQDTDRPPTECHRAEFPCSHLTAKIGPNCNPRPLEREWAIRMQNNRTHEWICFKRFRRQTYQVADCLGEFLVLQGPLTVQV